jgi:hypothetical protein
VRKRHLCLHFRYDLFSSTDGGQGFQHVENDQRWYRSDQAKYTLRIAGAALAAAGLGVIAWDLLSGQLAQAGSVGDLSGGIVTLVGIVAALSTLHPRGTSSPEQVHKAAASLVQEIGRQWGRESERRGIKGSGIAALSWTVTRTPEAADSPELGKGREEDILSGILQLYQASPHGRLLITGLPGSGKSTMLVLLTSSLVRDGQVHGPIPVILTLSSWDTSREDFRQWILRRLNERYPSLRRSAYGGDALEQLFEDNRILLMLDGLDELSAAPSVIGAIRKSWPANRPLVIASRADSEAEGDRLLESLGGIGQHAHLELLSPGETLRYISHGKPTSDPHQARSNRLFGALLVRLTPRGRSRLSVARNPAAHEPAGHRSSASPARLVPEDFLEELSSPGSTLGRVLRLPFYAYLARETMTEDFVKNFGEMKSAASRSGVDGIRILLVAKFVRQAFSSPKDLSRTWGDPPPWGTKAIRRQLSEIARLAEKATDNNIVWWRFQRLVPVAAWAAFIGITAGLMYWLTGDLPSGLRRGAPLGFTLSIAIGLTRGTVSGKKAGVIAAIVSAPLIVAAGVTVVGFWQALEDAAEISLAVGLGTAMLPTMFSSWRGLIRMGGLIAVLMGVLTGVVEAIQYGTPAGVNRFLNTSLGASEVIVIPGGLCKSKLVEVKSNRCPE